MDDIERKKEDLQKEIISKLRDDKLWDHLSPKSQEELEYMEIPELVNEAAGVAKSMNKWNADQKEEWSRKMHDIKDEAYEMDITKRRLHYAMEELYHARNVVYGGEEIPKDYVDNWDIFED